MAEKPRVIIDDGFGKPFKSTIQPIDDSGTDDIIASGRDEPESRTEDDKRTPEPNAKFSGFDILSPVDITGSDAGTSSVGSSGTGRGRGRPRGSKNRTEKTETPGNLILDFESLLLSGHFMLAKMLEVKELELDESEAKRLSDAIKKVTQYYHVSIDPKKMAIYELCMTAGTIYGPRAVAFYKDRTSPIARGPRINTQPAPASSGSQPVPQPTPRPNGAPRTPSEMWNQAPIDNDEL